MAKFEPLKIQAICERCNGRRNILVTGKNIPPLALCPVCDEDQINKAIAGGYNLHNTLHSDGKIETNWKLKHREGDKYGGDTYWGGIHQSTRYSLDLRFAGPGFFTNAADIEESSRTGASGSKAFGGAKTWPHVRLNISLPAYGPDLRSALSEMLREAVSKFAKDHKLDQEDYDGES